MHDYQAVTELIERLASQDVSPGGIAEVRIRASAVYIPEALRQAYEMLVQDTPLEGSRLVVESLPDLRTCPACGTSRTVMPEDVAGHLLICPSCGAPSPARVPPIELVVVSGDRA